MTTRYLRSQQQQSGAFHCFARERFFAASARSRDPLTRWWQLAAEQKGKEVAVIRERYPPQLFSAQFTVATSNAKTLNLSPTKAQTGVTSAGTQANQRW